ncbi:MAG: hypothetical protein C5B51_17785 [Terriglobia bacterium]|nr:MAG: hypothetical protein C5B51_17785 [Terriglobia bacterium]
MASIPPPIFSGVSKYASDFQQVLNRAVAIASLPLQQMEDRLSLLTSEQSAFSGLQSVFASFESAIQGIGSAAQGAASATVSDPSILQATATTGALPGTYTVEVTSLGSYTTTLSKAGLVTVTDPASQDISSASSFTLTINGAPHTITPSGNSLQSLAAAINGAGLGAAATIVNVGSTSSPDYRLSVTSSNLAGDTIQLNDGSQDLLDTLSTGAPATYRVNGLNTDIQSNSREITLAPGLTANLLEASPGNPVTITVSQEQGLLSNSLTTFVNAYNAAADALNRQHGKNAGPLLGQSLVFTLGQALQSVVQYSASSGTLTSLADLGITMDDSGHLSLDTTVLNGRNLSDVQKFLGATGTGGFLETAKNAISAMEDPSTGAIESNLTSIQSQITNQNTLISNETDRINALATNLQKQLSDADATISLLQQQVTFMTNLFSSMFPNQSNKNNGG